jgi:cytochrome c2
MAALLWNHGPTMWAAMRSQSIEIPALTEEQMRDIYTYFHALRYFDPPGDAARGKAAFTSKQCYRCHALTSGASGIGPSVSMWPALSDPVLWVEQMWNHAGEMARELETDAIRWPNFTIREMADLIVYLRHLPGLQLMTPTLRLGDATNGARLFGSKNCAQCHTLGEDQPGKVDLLDAAQEEHRLTGLAVEMWNHRPLMEAAARNRGLELEAFQNGEMADLLAYLFESGYFAVRGEAGRGRRLFSQKGCAACHGQAGSAAPDLEASNQTFTATGVAAAVWRHGPAMLDQMQQRGIGWPTLTDRDVGDLIAFLNQ